MSRSTSHPVPTFNSPRRGFTIVELLIVVVVIAILAAITIVSFNGITQRSKQTTVLSDASNAANAMEVDNVTDGSYAGTAEAANNGRGIVATAGNSYSFHSTATTYCITVSSSSSGVNSYYVSNITPTPTLGSCAQGIHTALLISAPIMSLSIVAAFFVKKAKKSAGAVAGH